MGLTLKAMRDRILSYYDEGGLYGYDVHAATCSYRAPDGGGAVGRCAVGVLIPDSVYTDSMEGATISGISEENNEWTLSDVELARGLTASGIDLGDAYVAHWLGRAQDAHDSVFVGLDNRLPNVHKLSVEEVAAEIARRVAAIPPPVAGWW